MLEGNEYYNKFTQLTAVIKHSAINEELTKPLPKSLCLKVIKYTVEHMPSNGKIYWLSGNDSHTYYSSKNKSIHVPLPKNLIDVYGILHELGHAVYFKTLKINPLSFGDGEYEYEQAEWFADEYAMVISKQLGVVYPSEYERLRFLNHLSYGQYNTIFGSIGKPIKLPEFETTFHLIPLETYG